MAQLSCDALGPLLVVSATLSYGMQLLNCLFSYLGKGDNFTGVVEFLPAAVIGLSWSGSNASIQQILTSSALIIWSVRLTAFLVYRFWWRTTIDTRLGAVEHRSIAILLGFWILHGSWGFFVSLPVTLINGCVADDSAQSALAALTPGEISGLLFWALGFVIEAWADHVKLQAYRNRRPRYFSMDGHLLWRYCRHPNFLGEFLCWFGLSLTTCVHFAHRGSIVAVGLAVAVWLSPLMTLFIMLGEAALLAEWKNNSRFGSDASFQAYRKRTSLLWPCPPSCYTALPRWVRTLVFFEWPQYDRSMEQPMLWADKQIPMQSLCCAQVSATSKSGRSGSTGCFECTIVDAQAELERRGAVERRVRGSCLRS